MQKQVKLKNDIFKTNIFGKKTKILCKGTYADLLEEKVIVQQRDIYTLNRDDVEIIDIKQFKGIFANVNDDMLLRNNAALSEENQQLKEKINTYENPEDLTLMFMYCDENAKDKIKQLKEIIEKVREYVTNHSLYEEEYDYDYEENSYLSGIDDETATKDILQILDKAREGKCQLIMK